MPDKSRSSDADRAAGPNPDVLRHHTPKGLKLAGLVALGVGLALVIVWGAGHRVSTMTARRATGPRTRPATVVHLVSLQASQSGDFTCPGDVEAFTVATIFAQITGYVQKWDVRYRHPGEGGSASRPDRSQALSGGAGPGQGRAGARQRQPGGSTARPEALCGRWCSRMRFRRSNTPPSRPPWRGSDTGVVETDKAAVETAQINLNYTRISGAVRRRGHQPLAGCGSVGDGGQRRGDAAIHRHGAGQVCASMCGCRRAIPA